MAENITPDAAREALRAVEAAPRPSKTVSSVALALALVAWTPGFLANAWSVKHDDFRMSWWIAGFVCTAVLVCISLVLVARQRRVARGWRQAPLIGLGIAGLFVGFSNVLVQHFAMNGWLVVALAIAGIIAGYAGGRALVEAPDDLGLSR